MQELNFKIKQVNEEWKEFNDKVIRMNVDYQVRFYVPAWFNLEWLNDEDDLESFNRLEYVGYDYTEDYSMRIYTYNIRISSVAKCDTTKDEFYESTGIYICETRAEIKILEKVRKIMEALYTKIKAIASRKDYTLDLISERLDKNKWNLERLKGTYDNLEDDED